MNAIAISGGDTRGAGGAARIASLDLEYQVGVGISTGAVMLVPAMLRRHDLLKSHYTAVSQKDIFSKPIINGKGNIKLASVIRALVTGKPYLATFEPMKKRLTKMFVDNYLWEQLQESGKEAIVGVYNIQKQCIEWKSSKIEDMKDFIDYTIASASVPALVKPLEKDGYQYVDGGVVESCPLYKAALYNPDKVVAIKHAPKTVTQKNKTPLKNLIQAIGRSIIGMRTEISRNDLTEGINYCDLNNITYEIHYISQGFYDKPMDFDKEKMYKYYSESFSDNSNPLTNAI